MYRLFLKNSIILFFFIFGCVNTTLSKFRKMEYCSGDKQIKKYSVALTVASKISFENMPIDEVQNVKSVLEYFSDVIARNFFLLQWKSYIEDSKFDQIKHQQLLKMLGNNYQDCQSSIDLACINLLYTINVDGKPLKSLMKNFLDGFLWGSYNKLNLDEPLNGFANRYVLMASEDDQIKLFKVAFGMNSKGDFSPMKAIKEKDAMWAKYFESLTIVKKSNSVALNRMDYLLELNLNPFCAYGMKKTDLLSK